MAAPLIAPARLGSSTWLLHLRSFAVAGQLLTILAAGLLTDIDLPYLPLVALVSLTAATNLVYGLWLGHVLKAGETSAAPAGAAEAEGAESAEEELFGSSLARRRVALGLMLLDLVTLTGMLYFSGGADNPFSFFYFVNLAVGGVMIRPRAAWSLTVLAIAGYTFLLFESRPVAGLTVMPPPDVGELSRRVDLRTAGRMLAFATCSSVVTYYVTRTAGELKRRDRELRRAQAAHAASQRLESLTTLAAGAAHELATPLSTIDVIVRELSRRLETVDKPESVDTDLRLVDSQLDRCRQILARMRSAAGDTMAQRWQQTTLGDLIDATLEGVRDPHRVDVPDADEDVENQPLWLPEEAVAQAIRNLVHNGLDASGPDGRVQLQAWGLGEDRVRIAVTDSGQGMSHEVLDRAGDPFFTTKEPGRGIGLGLFLARNVISRLGGEITFESKPAEGTRAVVTLPVGRPPARA